MKNAKVSMDRRTFFKAESVCPNGIRVGFAMKEAGRLLVEQV